MMMPESAWQATSAAGGSTARRTSSRNSATNVTAVTRIVAGRPSRWYARRFFHGDCSFWFRLSKMEPAAPPLPHLTALLLQFS